MLRTIASQRPEQEWLFLLKAPPSTALAQHRNLWTMGVLTVLARIHVGWLFFLEEPGITDIGT